MSYIVTQVSLHLAHSIIGVVQRMVIADPQRSTVVPMAALLQQTVRVVPASVD